MRQRFNFRRKRTALKTAKKALRLAKNNQIVESTSYNDILVAMSRAPTVRYIQPPSCDGFKQTCQYIEGRLYVQADSVSSENSNWRVDLVLDRQPAGVVLDTADLYGTAQPPRITALIPLSDKERYKIVKSWSGGFNDAAGPTSRMVRRFHLRSGLKLEASAVTPSQAEIQKNAYYLVFWTDASANTPIITYDLQMVSVTA